MRLFLDCEFGVCIGLLFALVWVFVAGVSLSDVVVGTGVVRLVFGICVVWFRLLRTWLVVCVDVLLVWRLFTFYFGF